jgi:long-chain acyl-CoA synthetase
MPAFTSIVDLFEQSTKKFADRELFGVKKDGVWSFVTYGDVKKRVDNARGGLASLGFTRGDRLAIISNNRVEWAVAAYAANGLGGAVVPMYEVQHAEEWEFIIGDCGAKVLVVANKKILEKVKAFSDKLPSLEHIVCIEGGAGDEGSFAWLLEKGKANATPAIEPDTKDTACFIYTSGTTGQPKGVILSHGNIASNVSAVQDMLDVTPDDRSLSFLPWAHSFGFTCELHHMVSRGASMALNSSVENLVAELAEVRPTMLYAVPRIFNRIYDGVNKQMAERPPFIQNLFKDGVRLANKSRDGGPLSAVESVKLWLARKIIFSKIILKFGGRLKYAFSGGAALSKDVANFIDGLGIIVYEGYGLTETSPIATCNSPKGRRVGSVGMALPGVEILIDKKITGDETNGEILVKGPNIMQGYHNRPEENAAVLMPDGAFRTGDMGHVDSDGFLWITGRIKEQYKLENGKYIVPSPLEEELKLSPWIINVMIHGANKPYNVALLVPDPDTVKKWAESAGIKGSYEEILENKATLAKMGEELEKASKAFRGIDRVKKFALIAEDFSTTNDMLTPSLKLKRRNVIKKYNDKIEALYE